jgi:hypothetical protein
MIERQTINGRKATIADFTPCERDGAELVKVIFDNGEVVFLIPPREPDVPIDESKLDLGQLDMIRLMRRAGIVVTRENYIDVAWGAERPEPWTPEHEAMLPEVLQETWWIN